MSDPTAEFVQLWPQHPPEVARYQPSSACRSALRSGIMPANLHEKFCIVVM